MDIPIQSITPYVQIIASRQNNLQNNYCNKKLKKKKYLHWYSYNKLRFVTEWRGCQKLSIYGKKRLLYPYLYIINCATYLTFFLTYLTFNNTIPFACHYNGL